MSSSRSVVAIVAASLFLSSAALAQDGEKDAERLFQEGQKLLSERRYGEACPKLEQAYQKDRQLGTLLNLAYCHKEQGAVWQAWLEFKEAEIKATELKMNDRKAFASKSRVDLEKQLARVIVDVPRDSKLELQEVLVEERRVPEAERGSMFYAEPGQRKFTFKAKGKKPAHQLFVVSKGDKPTRVPLPEFEEDTGPPPAAAPAKEEPRTPPVSAPPPGAEASDGSSQRLVAYGLFGLAAVGVGVGAVTGLKALGSPCRGKDEKSQQDFNRDCPPSEFESSNTSATVATVSFAIAGTALAAGLFLFFTAPKAKDSSSSARVRPMLGLGYAGMSGTF